MSLFEDIVKGIKKIFGGTPPYQFIFTDRFVRDAKRAAKKDRNLTEELTQFCKKIKPSDGDRMPRTGGCHKVRMEGKGKGSSGAYRIIVFMLCEGQIHFLHLYTKNEKDNLSSKDEKDLRISVEEIKTKHNANQPKAS